MALVDNIEKRIKQTEGFVVHLRHPGGPKIRRDKQNLPMYDYARAAKGTMTVAGWIAQRFKPSYVGYEARVLLGDGSPASGNTRLSNVRDSYS